MTCRIILVSHALTQWNIEGRIQGHTDVPLHPVGWAMAQWLAQTLSREAIDAIYTSDLIRAFQTALPTAREKSINIMTDMGLREGRTFRQERSLTYQTLPFAKEVETVTDLVNRMTTTLSSIADRHDNESILAVSHAGALDYFIRSLIPNPEISAFSGIRMALNRIEYNAGLWQIIRLNEKPFLSAWKSG